VKRLRLVVGFQPVADQRSQANRYMDCIGLHVTSEAKHASTCCVCVCACVRACDGLFHVRW